MMLPSSAPRAGVWRVFAVWAIVWLGTITVLRLLWLGYRAIEVSAGGLPQVYSLVQALVGPAALASAALLMTRPFRAASLGNSRHGVQGNRVRFTLT